MKEFKKGDRVMSDVRGPGIVTDIKIYGDKEFNNQEHWAFFQPIEVTFDDGSVRCFYPDGTSIRVSLLQNDETITKL